MASTDGSLIYLPILADVRGHLIGNVVLAVLSTITIGLRLYGRVAVGFGWDDILIVIAWMFSMSLVAESGFLASIGDGYDFFTTDPAFPALYNNLSTFMKVVLSFQLLYMCSLTTVKCSVLAFYRRVFVNDSMKKLTLITIGFVLCWCVGHSLAMVFICHPTAFWWDMTIPGGYCLNQVPIYVSLIVTNIFTDLVIMCLPMLTIWKLKMKTTEKLALTAAFALGIASIAVAIWRLVTVFQLNIADNLTGTVELAVFLCTLETVLALFCVNIPLLRPLYRRFIVRQSSSKLNESGGNYGSSNYRTGGSSNMVASNNAEVELDSYIKNSGFERSVYIEEGSVSDSSEKRLNTSNNNSNKKPKKGDILVKTEWTLESNR